jgi:hypothetical protein
MNTFIKYLDNDNKGYVDFQEFKKKMHPEMSFSDDQQQFNK